MIENVRFLKVEKFENLLQDLKMLATSNYPRPYKHVPVGVDEMSNSYLLYINSTQCQNP